MTELIKVTKNSTNQNIVSARELYKVLEVKRKFSLWVDSNFKDYDEGVDFTPVLISTPQNQYGGTQEIQDYAVTLDMAKHLAMVSKTEKGKEVRKYFIKIEKKYKNNQLPTNYKEALLHLVEQVEVNERLMLENTQKDQIIGELKPKADYLDQILKSKSLVTVTQIAKDYGMSAKAMNEKLHELKVQFKQSGQWLLYSKYHSCGYTHSETINITRSCGESSGVAMNTKWTQKGRLFIYELFKKNNILPMIERDVA